jgi:oxygen-dependent protoporphyrinogen oxidase
MAPERRDVVIVGAGVAGLTAAHRLRDLSPLVLEAGDRAGGRVCSVQRGDLALSVGAHMFPAPGSLVGRMATDLGLETRPITGSMLNVHSGGRLIRDTRPELLPLRLPLSARGRVAMAGAGLRLRRTSRRYLKTIEPRPGESGAQRRERALWFECDRTFGEFLGPLPDDAWRVFRALANRSVAEPGEISLGWVASSFARVWDTGDLGRNMVGGPARLTDGLAASLAEPVRLGSRVVGLRPEGDGWAVSVSGPEGDSEVRAGAIIAAVPAPDLLDMAEHLPEDTRHALAAVRFGPMAVLSVRTNETAPMPWDELYSILTPDASFNMFFNHANFLREPGSPKRGSVLMVYAGGDRARAFDGGGEADVERLFMRDLCAMFPQVGGIVEETMVRRWRLAGPFATPRRWRAQALLERGVGERLVFAGDWMSEFVSMDTAARSAAHAADRVRAALG